MMLFPKLCRPSFNSPASPVLLLPSNSPKKSFHQERSQIVPVALVEQNQQQIQRAWVGRRRCEPSQHILREPRHPCSHHRDFRMSSKEICPWSRGQPGPWVRHVPACSPSFDQLWLFHLPTSLLAGVGLLWILPWEKLFALQHILNDFSPSETRTRRQQEALSS